MKRIIFFAITLLLLLLAGCSFIRSLADLPDKSTESWQTVSISGVGSFRVPTEWFVEQQDEILYITDKPRDNEGYKIYLVGIAWLNVTESEHIHPHELLNGVEKGAPVPGRVGEEKRIDGIYSNCASVSLIEYTVNGEKEEHYLIDCPKIKGTTVAKLQLLVWDRTVVDEKLTSEIAKTFSMESS